MKLKEKRKLMSNFYWQQGQDQKQTSLSISVNMNFSWYQGHYFQPMV